MYEYKTERFKTYFLWGSNRIGVSIRLKIGDKTNPLMKYQFWPQRDAWGDLLKYLKSESQLTWISKEEVNILLCEVTEVIEYWQDSGIPVTKDFNKVKEKFPNSVIFKAS